MRFLSDNISVLCVFIVCAAFAWLFGGTRSEYLLPVIPWLTVLMVEICLCFPQRHADESSYEARERLWRDLKKDPILWLMLCFVAVLTIPFLNKGLCPICDYPAIAAGAEAAPPIPLIPFCVNRSEHLTVVLWFVPALSAALCVKHALLKRGKCLLVSLIVWNGLLLGILGALQQMTGARGPLWVSDAVQDAYFFSTFGYPNMAGDYFTTLFGLAVGLWRWRVDEMRARTHNRSSVGRTEGGAHHEKEGVRRVPAFWKVHYHLIPAVIFFFCAMDTLSRAAVILVTILSVVLFLHSFVCFIAHMKKAKRVKAGALSVLVLLMIATCAVMFMPEDLQQEVNTLNSTEVLNRVTGKGQYHVRVATKIWKDHFLFGVGGWGYKHFCIPYMTEKDLRNMQVVGGINVHNDYLQFLAEHGIVGFGLFAAIVVLLLWPFGVVWRAMVESVRFIPTKDQPPQPVQVFVIPPPAFFIFLTAISTFIHGLGDCPLRSPAVLTLFLVSLAAIDGYLPRLRQHRHG